MPYGKRCGCAGACDCVVFGDGAGSSPDQCIAVDGNGTPSFPYVVRNLCPGTATSFTGNACLGITGSGTNADPYIIQNLCPGRSTEGSCIDITGTGTTTDPYVVTNLCPGKVAEGSCIDITGAGTLANPYVVSNLCPGVMSIGTVGCGVTASVSGSGTVASPYKINVAADISGTSDNILTCNSGGLYVPPPPDAPATPDPVLTRMARIMRGPTNGVANCGGTHDIQNLPATKSLSTKDAVDAAGVGTPNGTADGTESGFFMMEQEVNALTITNPSSTYPMAVTLNVLGRARVDTRTRDYWPPASPNWAFGAQLRLGLTISGSTNGDRDYVTQRAQFNVSTFATSGSCTDADRETQNWTDWDTIPVLRVPAGGSLQISRWADLQVTDEASAAGSALTGLGGSIAREVRWNLPGITAIGVAAQNV